MSHVQSRLIAFHTQSWLRKSPPHSAIAKLTRGCLFFLTRYPVCSHRTLEPGLKFWCSRLTE